MFGNLFKPKIEHPDPAKRLEAVHMLKSSDEDIARLSQVVLNDVDENVRSQALTHLHEVLTDQSNLDSKLASSFIDLASSSMQAKFICHVKDPSDLEVLIRNAEDDDLLILLASKAVLPQVRKQAAMKLENLEALKLLQQQANDKNVLQIARQKTSQIKEKIRNEKEAKLNLNNICEAVQRLSRIEYEPMMESRLNRLQTSWGEMDDEFKAEFSQSFEQAANECKQIILQEKERAALEELEQSQNQLCLAICQNLESEICDLAKLNLPSWPDKKQSCIEAWAGATERFSPSVEISEKYFMLESAADKAQSVVSVFEQQKLFDNIDAAGLEELAECERSYFELTKQMNWPFSIKQPVLFDQLLADHSQVKRVLANKRKHSKDQLAKISNKVTVLKSHIRQKNLIKANRLFNYIQNLIDALPESGRQIETDRLQPVVNDLNELRGLNKFITEPKKEQLCEQMEALIVASLPAEKLMDKIKSIQEKWKSLATSDADADDVLWERFKQASDTAFLPCAVYLEELEQLKKKNLESRKTLAEKLQDTLADFDWPHADYKQIQTMYSNHWKQWRALSPVFYSHNKPVQKQFEALMDQLKEKLNVEKNENHQLYAQFIEKTEQLVESMTDENIEQTITQVKRIQVSWQNVGITHFNKSRKQWNKFRKLCDKIFDYQRNMHKTLLSEENQQADQAYAIIKQIKNLQKVEDEKLVTSQQVFQSLSEEFKAIEGLSERRAEKIQRQFDQASEQYLSHLSGLGERNNQLTHRRLRQAAQHCIEAETLALASGQSSDLDALQEEFKSVLPGGKLAKKLEQRFHLATQVVDSKQTYCADDLSENEQTLSNLIVELEVLFDLESPEDAKQQRMNYQLEQLQAGIKPAPTLSQKLEQLIDYEARWYQVGAVNDNARRQLELRLQAVIKQADT